MTPVVFEFELTVDQGLWGPFTTLCAAQGDNPTDVLREMCQIGMQLNLEEMVGIEDGVSIEDAEVDACYEDAVVAVSQWLSAKRGISLREAQRDAVNYLATL